MPTIDLPSHRIGPYEVDRLLGRGGAGTVYLAHRIDAGFPGPVAIKVLGQPFGGDVLQQRFARERRILAALTHPNIARLLDAGVTDEGQAYLVMEYVDGSSATSYVIDRALPVRERLALFRTICEAVEYAHQHLVVHRDLKPSNIFVDAAGTPKLLDFGTAKMIGDGDLTVAGTGGLTVAYASPEQLNGQSVSTLTDVFSLGAVLFELLTGQRLLGDDLAARSQGHVAFNRAAVPADVARIIDKATADEPSRRYPSARHLSDDVRRFIDNEPVHAARQTTGYRLRKFARRNRAAMVSTSVLAIGLVVATGLAAFQYRATRVARARSDMRLHELTRSMLVELFDELGKSPGGMQAQDGLIQKALTQYDTLVSESNRDPELMAEAGEAYLRFGNLLGNPYSNNKGQESEALATYRKGLVLLAGVQGSPRVDIARGHLHRAVGRMYMTRGDTAAALDELRQSVADIERGNTRDGTGRYDVDLLEVRSGFGDVMFDSDPKQALAFFDASAATVDAIRRRNPAYETNGVLEYKRGACEEMLGHLGAAIEHYHRGLEDNGRLSDASKNTPNNRRARASLLSALGSALATTGHAEDGMAPLDEAVTIARAMAAADPGSTRALFSVAANLSNRSLAARQLKRPDVLHGALLDESKAWSALLGKTQLPMYLSGAAANLDSLSQSYAALNNPASAREAMQRSLTLFRRVAEGTPTPEDRRRYGVALLEGGSADLRSPPQALEQLAAAMAATESPSQPLEEAYGLALLRNNRAAEAVVHFEKSVAMLTATPATSNDEVLRVQGWLAEARAAVARSR